jgi:hypothetical protein
MGNLKKWFCLGRHFCKTPQKFHRTMLKRNKLLSPVTKKMLQSSMHSSRVYYAKEYFMDNNTLNKLLTKTAAVSIDGNKSGFYRDGSRFKSTCVGSLDNANENMLSADECLLASKKIQASKSWVFAVGGYPQTNRRCYLDKPYPMGVFSVVGCQFENAKLHSRLFFLDSHQQKLNVPEFEHLYGACDKDYERAQKALAHCDENAHFKRLNIGFSFLTRNEIGKYGCSILKKNAIIFHSQAHYKYIKENVRLLLESVNHMAKEEGKPAFLKATNLGRGDITMVDCNYDMSHLLFDNHIKAYKEVLADNEFPYIAHIEFPIFDEIEYFNYVQHFRQENTIGNVTLSFASRDVLAFSADERDDYFVCAINPAKSNAYPGNRWDDVNVESACFGNNTTIRYDQVDVMNPKLLTRMIAIESTHH